LIELLVVIAIIALLLAILAPSLKIAKDRREPFFAEQREAVGYGMARLYYG